jgi:asparagine synthase (glutamine-hydrolysing)
MCGIAGILNRGGGNVNQAVIQAMTDAMRHRGPDSAGFFVESPIGLGHRRLSIIDLSSAANQPFFDHSGRYAMVFNGEMYNYEEVKRQIPEYPFVTTSDTEVLMAAFIKWGTDCLRLFRGMYAFAIWDRQEQELYMARDRMGVKPFYYFLNDDKFIFASEIRSILGTNEVPRKLDHAALLEYFSYQSVTGCCSIISGIRQLEAGTWMKVTKDGIEKKTYWDLTREITPADYSDTKTVQARIRELMLQSVQRRLVSDVPVGAFLSGGIDSSAVVGLMAEAGTARPNTFNIYFEEKEYDESAYADIIAEKFNTIHTRILLKPSVFLDELHNALQAMDTPSGDGINTYVVSKAIREQGMTVALSGVGGDELFAGYPFFNQFLQLQSKKALWKAPLWLRQAMAAFIPAMNGKKDRMKQLLVAPSPAIDQVYPIFRQLLSPALLRELTSLVTSEKPITTLQQELEGKGDDLKRLPLLSQVSVAEYLGYTQNTLLKDTDQMSMAVSLEVREPFFDQDLVQYILGVPDRLKKPVYSKSLLVESLKPLLPDEIVFRKKQGFLFPWNVWLKNDLRSFCEQRIHNISQRSFVNGPALAKYWNRFLAGDKNVRWGEIWLFVVLEYWLEKNEVV